MDKLNFEEYIKNKIEYDNKIRKLDLDIVAKSVELYNIKSRAKISNNSATDEEREEKLHNDIENIEEEKRRITSKIMQEFEEIKKNLIVKIDKAILQNSNDKESFITRKMKLNRIKDVYFDINDLVNINNFISKININLEIKQDDKISQNQFVEILTKNSQKKLVLDVKKQRVIDFENLLKYIYQISKNYRKSVEEKIIKYLLNYSILKDSELIQIELEKNEQKYINKFDEIICKFEKDEKIEDLKKKIEEIKINISNMKTENLNMIQEATILKNKIEELQEIYLVNGSATKTMNKFLTFEAENKNNIKATIDASDDVFEEIRKLTYNERKKHIVDVSKWTKNIENKITKYKIKENDFQFLLYLIRKTEDTCNINYERITNSIINLCDCYINLEIEEENNKVEKLILEENIAVAQILKDGINLIKRKYSKIPFIGRKVAYVLNTKALNS